MYTQINDLKIQRTLGCLQIVFRPAIGLLNRVPELTRVKIAPFTLLTALMGSAWAREFAPPPDYYTAVAGLFGTDLDRALNGVIRAHTIRTYNDIRQDLAFTDRDWAFPPPVNSPSTIA